MKVKLAVFAFLLPLCAFAREGHEHPSAFGVSGDSAAYLHLLTNHFPIIGILMGLIALSLAFAWKSDSGIRIALALLLLSNLAAYPTFKFGQAAYEQVRGIADDIGQDWLDTHMERAESLIYLFYFAALVAIITLFARWRKLRWANTLAIVADLLSAAALVAAGWIADAGGKVRHSDTRGNAAAPSSKTEPAHNYHE